MKRKIFVTTSNFTTQSSLFMHPNKMEDLRTVMFRKYSTKPTHFDESGNISMVDISDKISTIRTAEAKATVFLGPAVFQLIKSEKSKKGNVLTVAHIAGIAAAKSTSLIIPLCHNINLHKVKISFELDYDTNSLIINSFVKTKSETGVEMEALTSVTVAALTVYDMCKAVSKAMVIKDVKLLKKTGGKSDYFG